MSRSSIDAGGSDGSSRAGARALGVQGALEGLAKAGLLGSCCRRHCGALTPPRATSPPLWTSTLPDPCTLSPFEPSHAPPPSHCLLPQRSAPAAPRGTPAAHRHPSARALQSLIPPPHDPAAPSTPVPGRAEEGQVRGGGGEVPWLVARRSQSPDAPIPVTITGTPCGAVLPPTPSPASSSCSRLDTC